MKTQAFFITLTMTFLALLPLVGWSQEKYVPKPDEEIYGTWINEKVATQKIVSSPEGDKLYWKLTDVNPYAVNAGEIISKWTDSEGNIWYKSSVTRIKGPGKDIWKWTELDKLSKSGTVWESVWIQPTTVEEMKNPKYPTAIDPQDPNYQIYFKAQ